MFTFNLSPHEIFEERRKQFVAWGIPNQTIRGVEARVVDTWTNAPGGWTHEWVQAAQEARKKRDWMLAASLFGAARFPCVATTARQAALGEQVQCFIKASQAFPGHFDRQMVTCRVAESTVNVPVHVYAPTGADALPTVLLSGGVDTGKMELHRLALVMSKIGHLRVVAMDMPGTGETNTPLTKDADAIYKTVLDTFRGQGKVAIFGVSFGGHWAAKLALRREVDAAVNLGGPIGVHAIDGAYVAGLPNGMPGILANAMRLAAYPDEATAGEMLRDFGLGQQGLLNRPDCACLLAVNGSADAYIPISDVDVFRRYPSAEVWVLRGLSHCAAEKIMWIAPGMVTWLRKALHGDSLKNRLLHGLARQVLPERY